MFSVSRRMVRSVTSAAAAGFLLASTAGVAQAHPSHDHGHSTEPGYSHTQSATKDEGTRGDRERVGDSAAPAQSGTVTYTGQVTVLGDAMTVRYSGVIKPRKKMRISLVAPELGLRSKAKIAKNGVWEATVSIPVNPADFPETVKTRLVVKKKGVKKPVARVNETLESKEIFEPLPVPESMLPPAPAELAELSADATAYDYIALTADGASPVRWNRCSPIHVIVNPTGLHGDAMTDITAALAELSRASGLTFTGPEVRPNLPPTHPDGRIISEPGAITISTATPDDIPGLAGKALAYGGIEYRGKHITAGYVSLDISEDLAPGFDPATKSLGKVLLHELGHAVNLAHVDNPGQIMNPTLDRNSPASYQAGDVAGLNGLAAFGCETT